MKENIELILLLSWYLNNLSYHRGFREHCPSCPLRGCCASIRKNGVLTWLLSDHLGSTSVTADGAGNLLTSLKYTAFGELRSGTSLTDYQYTGQRNEAEIGLYYYFARFYDPALGRFRDLCAPERSLREGISADTIVPEPGSVKAYDRFTYTNNNPINFSDPSGYKACNGWDEQGKCVNDEKISSMTYVKGKTKNQLEAVYQNQGNSNYCGDFSLAMIIQLITGKKITGNDVANFMVRNLKQIPTMGIPGIPLASGAQKLLPNNRVIYQKDGKISQVERNVDNGVFTIVGVSWQTNEEIVTQMKDNVKNKKPLLHQVLVGHWMVVAGYDEYTKKILLLDSGKVEGFFTEYSYGEFIQIWTKQANSFIGSGDMLSIE